MRIGQVIKVKPEQLERYVALHSDPWPEVDSMIRECNIRDYSICVYGDLLFASFDYTGDDYEADMAKMAADPKTQEWWALCKPCQEPVEEAGDGEWWKNLREVYHLD
jgi:L-rhamnose mutarotase